MSAYTMNHVEDCECEHCREADATLIAYMNSRSPREARERASYSMWFDRDEQRRAYIDGDWDWRNAKPAVQAAAVHAESSESSYGIGRVPADVDPVTELVAEMAATQMVQRMTAMREHVGFAPADTTDARGGPADTMSCETCGSAGWWNPGAGQALCQRHWDAY